MPQKIILPFTQKHPDRDKAKPHEQTVSRTNECLFVNKNNFLQTIICMFRFQNVFYPPTYQGKTKSAYQNSLDFHFPF